MKKPRQHRKAAKRARTRMGLLAWLLGLAGLARGFVGVSPRGIAFNGASQSFLTPNGAERNIHFNIENDSCDNVSGKVYDITGHQVATMTTAGACGLGGNQAL